MKLKIEGAEVVIDWGAQTVTIRKDSSKAASVATDQAAQVVKTAAAVAALFGRHSEPLVHWHTATEHCKGGRVDGGWGEVTCPDCLRANPEEKPVYGWVTSDVNPDVKDLTVNGVQLEDFYIWERGPGCYISYPECDRYKTRTEAEAAVIEQYEADHA